MLKILSSRKSSWREFSNAYVHPEDEVLRMCKKCYSFNYSNGWYFDKPPFLQEKDPEEEVSVQWSHCPACAEEELYNTYDVELFRAFMKLKNKPYDFKAKS